MDHLFNFCLVYVMISCGSVYDALWSHAGKGLTSWLSFVMSNLKLPLPHRHPGSDVVLDSIGP